MTSPDKPGPGASEDEPERLPEPASLQVQELAPPGDGEEDEYEPF